MRSTQPIQIRHHFQFRLSPAHQPPSSLQSHVFIADFDAGEGWYQNILNSIGFRLRTIDPMEFYCSEAKSNCWVPALRGRGAQSDGCPQPYGWGAWTPRPPSSAAYDWNRDCSASGKPGCPNLWTKLADTENYIRKLFPACDLHVSNIKISTGNLLSGKPERQAVQLSRQNADAKNYIGNYFRCATSSVLQNDTFWQIRNLRIALAILHYMKDLTCVDSRLIIIIIIIIIIIVIIITRPPVRSA